jgi:hypothetical protein
MLSGDPDSDFPVDWTQEGFIPPILRGWAGSEGQSMMSVVIHSASMTE